MDFHAENGDNTGSDPGATTVDAGRNNETTTLNFPASVNQVQFTVPSIRKTVTSTGTVFLNFRFSMGTPSFSRMTVIVYAERIK